MALADPIIIKELTITHGRDPDNIKWELIKNNQSFGYFEDIIIEESMLGTVPTGTLILKDQGDIAADFNFTGKDKLKIVIIDITGTERTFDNFYIYQINRLTNYQTTETSKLISLKFVDGSYFTNSRVSFEFEEDIKLISATDETDNWIKDIFQQYFPNDNDKIWVTQSSNYAWLKNKNLTHPTARRFDNTKFLTLLNYLSEYATSTPPITTEKTKQRSFLYQSSLTEGSQKEEPVPTQEPFPDMFFWKDLHTINFASVRELIDTEPVSIFSVTDTEAYSGPISNESTPIKIDYIEQYTTSFMDLENNGAFASYYERIDPNLDDPLSFLLDQRNSLTRKNIYYNITDFAPVSTYNFYDSVVSKWKVEDAPKFENFPLELNDIVIPPQKPSEPVYVKRFYDPDDYGYFDTFAENSPYIEPIYTYRTNSGYTLSSEYSSRASTNYWQCMFDIEEENPVETVQGDGSGTTTKEVAKKYIKFKKLNVERTADYYKLRSLKEKWNVYKYVICCIYRPAIESFWALITNARQIPGQTWKQGVAYEYSWQEINFFPTGISGFTFGASSGLPNDPSVSLRNPKFAVNFGSRISTTNLYEIVNEGQDPVFQPDDGGPNPSPIVFDENDPNAWPLGTTLEYSSLAYNINEFFNGPTGGINYAGPGTNFNIAEYPVNFFNIPVGGYHYPPTGPYTGGIAGQIVRMYQIDVASIPGITFNRQSYELMPFIYVFDVANDKEGTCDVSTALTATALASESICIPDNSANEYCCCIYDASIDCQQTDDGLYPLNCPWVECYNTVIGFDESCINCWSETCAFIASTFCGCTC